MKTTIAFFGIVLVSFVARGQSSGQLDVTFNATGTQILSPGIMHDNINAMAIQSDQKIIGLGMTMSEGNFNFDLCIVRLMPDGSVDTSFGTDGYFTYDHAGESDFIYDGVILADDKILACGAVSITPDNTEIMLLRLNSDGTPDDTFGDGDGMVVFPLNSGQDYANGLVVLENGSIVIAGSTAMPNSTVTRGIVLKFDSDGAIDTTFGLNGYNVVAYATENDVLQSLIKMADGGFMTAGYSSVNFSNIGWVCRVTAEGDLDTSFGDGGHYIYDPGYASFVDVISYAGEYVVCGSRLLGNEDVVLIGLQADGSLSTTFGTAGEVIVDIDEADAAHKLFVDSQNGLIVAGSAGPSFFERNAMVLRVDATGALDASFATDGVFNVSFAANFDVLWGVAEQADDKLVLGGLASENDNNMLIMRINGAGTVGIDEPNTHSDVTMYPQPARHELNISKSELISRLTIYSLTGQMLWSEKVLARQHSLDVSSLSEGCYTLEVVGADGTFSYEKFIISKI